LGIIGGMGTTSSGIPPITFRPLGRRAFSLVELLVVLGIVALLISLLAPALSGVRKSAQSTTCLSQLRQLGMAVTLYAHDHHGLLPRSSHSALAHSVMPWGYALMPYLGKGHYDGAGQAWDDLFNGLYRCPADPRTDRYSYGKNVWFELTAGETGEFVGQASGPIFPKISSCKCGCAPVLFGEINSNAMTDHAMAHFWHFGGEPEIDRGRHGRTSNYVFLDGHAESLPFNETFDLSRSVDRWNPTCR
jgi:prepilin-type processing-associated H-X9-DG protein/prepilin-type N-terminal cleavage/methylation domain-containing protein